MESGVALTAPAFCQVCVRCGWIKCQRWTLRVEGPATLTIHASCLDLCRLLRLLAFARRRRFHSFLVTVRSRRAGHASRLLDGYVVGHGWTCSLVVYICSRLPTTTCTVLYLTPHRAISFLSMRSKAGKSLPVCEPVSRTALLNKLWQAQNF